MTRSFWLEHLEGWGQKDRGRSRLHPLAGGRELGVCIDSVCDAFGCPSEETEQAAG